jgi:hypothetical protein
MDMGAEQTSPVFYVGIDGTNASAHYNALKYFRVSPERVLADKQTLCAH